MLVSLFEVMGRFVIIVAMAAWAGSAGCAKSSPARAPAPLCPPTAPSPAPAQEKKAPVAPPPAATLDSPGGEQMAVVVLMVPGGGGSNDPHEYKLSLAANAESAAVEVDGQPMGAARVQHLTSSAIAHLGTRSLAPAIAPRPRLFAPDLLPDRAARSRVLPATMRPRELSPFAQNPNGAPIID